jgi:hypothetical protein
VTRRIVLGVVAAGIGLIGAAGPALAHTEWEPATAAPGSVIDLTLFVEDESSSAGTNQVELVFPGPITVTALPAVPGWTATVVGGQLGGPATGVTWSGGPEPGDVRLPIRLGPLPTTPGRLQFRVLQTYDNGQVDRWIEDWPAGAPEPASPGPVLDLVVGGPGVIPVTTTTAPPTTTTEPATTTTEAEEAAPVQGDEDDGSSALPILIAVLVVLAAAAGVAYAVIRARRRQAS